MTPETRGIVILLRDWALRKRQAIEDLKQSQADHIDLYCAGMLAVIEDLEATIIRAYTESK